MDIRYALNKLAGRFKRMSGRERTVTALTVFFIVMFAPYMFLYSPSEQRLKLKEQRVSDLNTEITSLNEAIKVRTDKRKVEPRPVITLPEANDLAGILATINREAAVNGVDFISISHEGFSYRGKFVEMRMKLEVRAGYRELHDFIRKLSLRNRLFMIQQLRYETNEAVYPSGHALLRAVAYLKKE